MTIQTPKIRGLSLEDPFGPKVTIPDAMSEQRCLEITIKVRAGIATQAEKHELAKGFIRLGLSIAAKFSKRLPRRSRDLVSCAMFGIVYAINMASEKMHDNNMAPWIASNVCRFCRRFIVTDHTVRIPSSTFYRRKKDGNPLQPILTVNLFGNDPSFASGREGADLHSLNQQLGNAAESEFVDKKRVKVNLPFARQIKERSRLQDIKETLEYIAENKIDRTILKMREEGFRDCEISEIVGKSKSWVNARRNYLEGKFEREFAK